MAFLHEPFERDEGVYAYIGQEILRGEIPYRDTLDIKPPGVFYLYATGIALFGETTESIRLFTAFYALLTIISVYLVARRLRGGVAALCAALIYSAYSTLPHLYGSSSNTEVFLVLPLVLSSYFFLKIDSPRRNFYLMLSGFCSACAMLVKTVAIAQVLLLLLLLLVPLLGERKLKAAVSDFFFFTVPMLLIAGGTMAYFAAKGAFEELFYWNVIFPRTYMHSDLRGPNWFLVFAYLFIDIFPLFAIGVPSTIWIYLKTGNKDHLLVLLSIVAAFVAVILPGKLFPHYFILLLPPLAIAAGMGLGEVVGRSDGASRFASLLLFVLLLFPVQKYYRYYFVYSPEEVSTKKYGPVFVKSYQLAEYIRENTLASDYIYQWGMSSELYFLSGRRSPNKFTSNYMLQWSPSPRLEVKVMTESIGRKKPKFIYIDRYWADTLGYDELMQLVAKDYSLDRKDGYGSLYRRRV